MGEIGEQGKNQNVSYFDLGDNYKSIYTYQNSSSCTQKKQTSCTKKKPRTKPKVQGRPMDFSITGAQKVHRQFESTS